MQNSFCDFSKDYLATHPDGQYKPTAVYHNYLTTHDSEQETTKNTLFKFQPNTNTHGSTWDAKHLDNFINASPWGKGLQSVALNSDTLSPTFKGRLRSSIAEDQTKLRGSHFFHNGPKLEDNYKVKDFSYKLPSNRYNQMVSNSPPKLPAENMKAFYDKNFVPKDQAFDRSKLLYASIELNGTLPTQRRAEMEESKQNQLKYSEWKGKNMEINKKHRVFKNGYRSGIMGFDGPMNDQTQIYKEDHDILTTTLVNKRKIEDRHLRDLEKTTRTTAEIEFHNKAAKDLETPEKLKAALAMPIAHHNGKIHVKEEFVKKWSDTQNRLFGAEVDKYSLPRAAYLRNQELRGRNADILSNCKNDVELKVDKGTLDSERAGGHRRSIQ
jgi:hypothetical protein